jgi:hypothetical protein
LPLDLIFKWDILFPIFLQKLWGITFGFEMHRRSKSRPRRKKLK